MPRQTLTKTMTVIKTPQATVLFSYNTPVAAFVNGRGYIKTSTKYSVTTSRHIRRWLGLMDAEEVDQSEIDALVKGIEVNNY